MKVYIMTDMEGVCGVINHDDWVLPSGRYYEEGKKLLTLEINAAVEGFYEAGAREILVVDGHGAGGVNQLLLDKRTTFLRTNCYPFGVEDSFDVCAWIGQHAKAGSEFAHIAHTGSFHALDLQINGVSMGEFGQMALIAISSKVTPIFISGDEAFAKEATALVPGIETVAVKQGVTPGTGDECSYEEYGVRNLSALHLHPEKARELIREGARISLIRFSQNNNSFHPPEVKPPFKMHVKYRRTVENEAYETITEANDIVELFTAPAVKVTTT